MDPLELLARDDRWHLSAGDGLLVGAPHPLWLHAPGFWDGATLLGTAIAPLFTVSLLDDDGHLLAPDLTSRRWTPAELSVEYRLSHGLVATEVRTVQPGGILASEWRLDAPRPVRVHLVAWTVQRAADLEGALRHDGTVAFRRRGSAEGRVLDVALACVSGATSWALAGSDEAPLFPDWRLTPFVGRWTHEGLRDTPPSVDTGTLRYAAVHRAMAVGADGASTAFAMRIVAPDLQRFMRPSAAAPVAHAATLGGASRRRWREFLAQVPAFRCSDPYVEHCYWYRWSLLELLSAGGRGVCDGTGPLHRLTSHGVASHVRDLRWLNTPTAAQGALRTLLDHVRADGSIPVQLEPPAAGDRESTAIGDWGTALLALDAAHPDDRFLRDAYDGLAKHARWLLGRRATSRGLVRVRLGDVAYADAARWAGRDELAGLDAAVAGYGILVALGRLALRAHAAADTESWDRAAQAIADAVRTTMWDEHTRLFRDVDPHTHEPVGPLTAVAFAPFASDLADARHLASLTLHLLDPAGFWTTFPVATRRRDDAAFSHDGTVNAARGASAFVGPVVPFVNAQIIDGLARAARAYAPELRDATAHLLRRTVRMFFEGADAMRVGSYEYYDPLEGHASMHRPGADGTHAWIIDAIMQYIAGVRPHMSGVTIDPIPCGMELVDVSGIRLRGHTLDVRIEGDRVRTVIDGVTRDGRLGTPMEVAM